MDRAARDVIEKAGYGEYFCHRTGHSIGQEDHGNGANMDDLETHETRRVLPRTCFSIEPGIYLPEFGVRSEVNVYVDAAAASTSPAGSSGRSCGLVEVVSPPLSRLCGRGARGEGDLDFTKQPPTLAPAPLPHSRERERPFRKNEGDRGFAAV